MAIRTLTRLKNRLSLSLGLNELSTGNRRFLFTHLNFLLFTTIPGVFMNTFFYRQNGKISTVIAYAGISCFVTALTMQYTSSLAIRKSPAHLMRIGVMLLNLLYFSILMLQNRASELFLLFAVINGISGGFYWQGYNVMLRNFTDDGVLNRTISIVGISNAAVQLVVPTLSGLLITGIGGNLGYTAIFLLALAFSLMTTFQSTRIPAVKIEARPNLGLVYRRIFLTPKWRLLFVSEFFRGMREIAFPTFLSIVFFKYIENEAVLGLNTMVCGLVSIFSFYLSGIIIKPSNRIKCTAVAAAVLLTTYLFAFVLLNAAVVFILSVINALMVTYITNPAVGLLFSAYRDGRDGTNFSQYMAAHEIFLACGRVAGCLAMMALTLRVQDYPYAMLALNLTAFLGLAFLVLSQKAGEKQDAD